MGCSSATYQGTTINRLVRLNADGSIDTAFNTGTSLSGPGLAVLMDPSGSHDVYVGGNFTTYNGAAAPNLVRINSDGTVDAAFAIGTGANFPVRTLVAVGDGTSDIYVGGSFTTFNGAANVNGIIRLRPDGTRVAGFSTGTAFGVSPVQSLLLSPDGSGDLYVGGLFTTFNGTANVNRIARLNADGSLDTDFATGTGFNGSVLSLSSAPDGSSDIYAGGQFTAYDIYPDIPYFIRLKSDGSRVNSVPRGVTFNGRVDAIEPSAEGDGAVYAGGAFTSYRGTTSSRIVRIALDGSFDTAFNTGVGFNNLVYVIRNAPGSTGDVYVGGAYVQYGGVTVNNIVRINSDGSRDAAFATGTGFNFPVYAIAAVGDGTNDVYFGGDFTTLNGVGVTARMIRLTESGTVSAVFAPTSGFSNTVNDIKVDSTGDAYVAGSFTSYNGTIANRATRLNPDGSIDTAFNTGTGFGGTVSAIALSNLASGAVYFGGNFTTYNGTSVNRITRVLPNGSLDPAFNAGTGFAVNPRMILAHDNGAISALGLFTTYNGTAAARLVRIQADGSLDTTFVSGTGPYGSLTELKAMAKAVDGSGDLFVGGDFTTYNGTTSNYLARLNGQGESE